jgi:hypothetical protein
VKHARYLVVLALVLGGVASASSAGLLGRGTRPRAYAVSTELKPAGDRLVAAVELRDLDTDRLFAGAHGICTIGTPSVFQIPQHPGLELTLTVREAGNHTLRYVVELAGVVSEFRYESIVSVP